MPLEHISTAVEAIVANAAKTSKTAQAAHEQAAAFHEALAGAIQAKEKLDATSNEKGDGWEDIRGMWTDRYKQAVEDATTASQNMPALWLINLAPELAKGEN